MLALSEQQREEMRVQGFTVMESFFQGAELDTLVTALEASIESKTRGVDEVGQVFLDLVDHPRILPYVVDMLGTNIQLRDALFGPVPAHADRSTPEKLRSAWHFDQEEEFAGTTVDGVMPLVDLKVSYYLSDHTEPGHACTLIVPGSHAWTPQQRSTWESFVQPEDVVALRVPIGSVLLWRSSLLHAVAPHLGATPRYHLYYAYIPRWIRPSFRSALSTAAHPDPSTDPQLMARCSPIRRQLLGGKGDVADGSASSQPKDYWFPSSLDQVPLHAWAAAQQPLPQIDGQISPDKAVGGGTQGHGVSHLRALAWGAPALNIAGEAGTGQEQRIQIAHRYFGQESPQLIEMTTNGLGYRNFMNWGMHPLWNQGGESKL